MNNSEQNTAVTDAAATLTTPLTLLGDPVAAACVGEFCDVPAHHEQAVVNRRLDADAV